MKKYKVEIPEGYEVNRAFTGDYCGEFISTTVVFKPIKKELPKTWEEYRDANQIHQWLEDWASIPEKHKALGKLEILRDHYNDGWIPDWKNEYQPKYGISILNEYAIIDKYNLFSVVLSFKTPELRDEFLSNFRDNLIEEAKPLL